MSAIKDVKVWRAPKHARPESRVYVHTADGREGCKYLTGNPWHKQFSIDGNLTEQEWAEAKALAVWMDEGKNCWHTVYQNETGKQHLDEEELDAQAQAAAKDSKPVHAASDYMKIEMTGTI